MQGGQTEQINTEKTQWSQTTVSYSHLNGTVIKKASLAKGHFNLREEYSEAYVVYSSTLKLILFTCSCPNWAQILPWSNPFSIAKYFLISSSIMRNPENRL